MCGALLAGCAEVHSALYFTGEIFSIVVPDPHPVCDKTTAGTIYDKQECLEFNGGTYRWGDMK